MANGSGGTGGSQDKSKFFCHSCGGVTVLLTAQEAAAERKHGHDLEAYPLQPQPAEVIRG